MNRVLNFIIYLSALYAFSQNHLMNEFSLMPWPTDITKNNQKFIIDKSLTISVLGNGNKSVRVQKAATSFLRSVSNISGVFLDEGFPLKNHIGSIKIDFKKTIQDLSDQIDESYNLTIHNKSILINAHTDIGVLRGLETLLQLLAHNTNEFYFPGLTIYDSPRFIWRGLMIDAARHFQPAEVIKRNLRAMSSVKMNVFHWHLSDDQGFRVESKKYPKLHQLASDGDYYTQGEIKEIINYADLLGIRVIPEIDIPGHATAILTAYPKLGSKDDYTYKIERFSGIFDPTLNPIKEETYIFLENLFTEIATLFPDEYFHIGGDENQGKHWDENKEIQEFKLKNNLKTNHDLQTFFNIRIEKILKKLKKKMMGWDEIMTPTMPKTAVIHSWRGINEGVSESTLITAVKNGYQAVLSNGYYIDRMESVIKHYKEDPINNAVLTNEEKSRVLGGEATMWSELVSPLTIDSRIWPRTAAIAERFWSKKEINDIDFMLQRLKKISFLLEELGMTHLKNRDVILRGITKNQDISSLNQLSKICEPLKIYSRNEGGEDYKTFSPLNLFADACVADAEDAMAFNRLVKQYLVKPTAKIELQLEQFLSQWSQNYKFFSKLNTNPILKKLELLSFNLSNVSSILLDALRTKKITKNKLKITQEYLEQLKNPVEDVEVVIIESLEKLTQSFNKN